MSDNWKVWSSGCSLPLIFSLPGWNLCYHKIAWLCLATSRLHACTVHSHKSTWLCLATSRLYACTVHSHKSTKILQISAASMGVYVSGLSRLQLNYMHACLPSHWLYSQNKLSLIIYSTNLKVITTSMVPHYHLFIMPLIFPSSVRWLAKYFVTG
jgi:hypothetical protein